MVAIEHRERQVVHIGVDTVSQHQQHERRTQDGEPEPNGVAPELQSLAPRIGEQAPQAEQPSRPVRARWNHGRRLLDLIARRHRGGRRRGAAVLICIHTLAIAASKQAMKAFSRVVPPQRCTSSAGVPVASTRPAFMSEDPVAALSLVHEMGRDENGDAVLAREITEQRPELIPRHGIDARGRLIEDQKVRLMDDGDSERQTLADAEGQIGGAGVELVGQREHGHQFRNSLARSPGRNMIKPGVQHEILTHGQLVYSENDCDM